MPLVAAAEPVVMLIDPDPVSRREVRALVEPKPYAFECYDSAHRFFEACELAENGCVLVDLAAPGIDGVGALEQFARRDIDFSVVFLAADYDAAMVVRALKAGAVNFLAKPCTEPRLWESAIDEAIAVHAEQRKRRSRRASVRRRLRRLTPGETDVLRQLLEGGSNRQIARDLDVSVRTVEERRGRLMRKMQAQSLAGLVRMVVEWGEGGL